MHVIPGHGVGKVSLGGRREPDARHSSVPVVEIGFDLLPCRGGFDVVIERPHAPLKLGVLRRRQAHILGREAVPKLAYEVGRSFGVRPAMSSVLM